MTEMLDAAERYIELGLGIIAISPGSKVPVSDVELQPSGSRSAVTDVETARKLWKLYPKAGVAICTGKVEGARLNVTVVDFDDEESYEKLKDKIPQTKIVKTPRGYHAYLKYMPEIKQATKFAGLDKVDTRQQGGYVICPPTVRGDDKYEWIDQASPLAEWPELIEMQNSYKPASEPRTAPAQGWDEVTQPSWVSEYLSEGVPEGQRANSAARLAGYLNSKHIPIDVARQLLETFRLACDPPMGERELDQTLQSIYRYIPAENVFANEDVSTPVVLSEIANRRVFRWSSEDLVVELSRIATSRNGIDCWIKFSTHTDPLFGPVRLNLLSSSGRESRARLLKNRKPLNWQMVLDQVSNMVSSSLEEGGAAKDMRFYTPESVDQGWCIRPYVQTNQATIMFGFAGNGKSTIATALLLSKATGAELLPGVDPGYPGAVLYADWEDSSESFNTSASAILHGHQLGWGDVIKPVLYRRYHGSLADHFDAIAADIAEHDIKLICVDSLVAASGDQYSPNDAEAARTWHQVVSALGVSSIGITHAAKNSKEPSAFGSVYYTNLARSIFEISADAEAGRNSSVIAVTHRKGNNTGLMKPVGLSVDFESDEFDNPIKIQYASADLTQSEVLATKLSSSDRILSLITMVSMSPAEIAEELTDLKPVTIRQALLRLKARNEVSMNSAGQYRKLDDVTS